MIGTLKRTVQAHRVVTTVVATAVVSLLVAGYLWFAPQKLFLDTTVNEAAPVTATPTTENAQQPKAGVIAAGVFRSLEHATRGRAVLIRKADGSLTLRLEGLNTSDGPDLRVYLSEIPTSNDWRAYGERYVDLGKLRGNVGNQNYAVPRSIDYMRYKSAVIWCRRFTVGFGVAPLTPA